MRGMIVAVSVGSTAARERIILAIDTSSKDDAERLARIAREAGARSVKLGLELSSATSWAYCSDLASRNELAWVADAKLDDISNTVAGAVRNIGSLEYPPFAITMHTTAGREAMHAAQQEAEAIMMLGVTVLTSIKDAEAIQLFGRRTDIVVPELARAAMAAGLKGVVASPLEVGAIKQDPATSGLFAMIPGVRSVSADKQDQNRVSTPEAAIRAGADLLVIGRQITQADDPAAAYEAVVIEVERAL